MSAFCDYTCLHFRICICVVPNAWLVYDTLGLYDLFYLLIIFIYFLDLALPIIIYPICMLYIRTFGMQLCLLLALPLGAWSSLNYLYTYCKCIYKLHGLCDDHRLWSEWRWLSNAFQIIPPQGQRWNWTERVRVLYLSAMQRFTSIQTVDPVDAHVEYAGEEGASQSPVADGPWYLTQNHMGMP